MKRDETFLPLQQKRKDKQLELVQQETVQGDETKRLRPKFLGVRDSRFYFRKKKYRWIDKRKVTHLKYQLRNERSTDILGVPQVMSP